MRTRMAGLGRGFALAATLTLAGASAAEAQVSFLGQRFFAEGSSVTVRYLGSSAGFFNTMQWFADGYDAVTFNGDGTTDYNNSGAVYDIFYNETVDDVWTQNGIQDVTEAPIGTEIELSTFQPIVGGQEILFGLFVHNEYNLSGWQTRDSDDYTYFSGPMDRNPDDAFHLAVTDMGGGTFRFQGGWEDIYNAGDEDYNDFIFEVDGVRVVPEPMSMVLLGSGLLGLAGVAYRRKDRDEDEVA